MIYLKCTIIDDTTIDLIINILGFSSNFNKAFNKFNTSPIYGRKYSRVGIVAAQIGKKIISLLQYKGAMNSQLFEQWFENCLLSELPYGSVIVMDNAAFHRKKQLNLIAQN